MERLHSKNQEPKRRPQGSWLEGGMPVCDGALPMTKCQRAPVWPFLGRRAAFAWQCGVTVLLVIGVLALRPLSAQTPSVSETQTPQQDMPSVQQPPAMPLSTTERVVQLSLEDAIRLALHNNLDLQRERFSPRIQHTEIEKARADFDPAIGVDAQISGTQTFPPLGLAIQVQQLINTGEITPYFKQKIVTGGSYELRFVNTREELFRNLPLDPGVLNPRFESSLQLTFTQPLLKDFGISVNRAFIHQAQKAAEIADQQVLQTILDTIFTVQQSYWDLVFRVEDLGAKRESQKLAEDFLAENKVRVELGTMAPIELVQAETQVKAREGDVIVAEEAVEDAEDQLKDILNLPETMGTWLIRLRPTDTPPFVPVLAISVQEKIATALKNRPDFVQSQLNIASREIDRQVARNQTLPRLDLVARGGLSAFGGDVNQSFADLLDLNGYEWLVGFARNDLQKRNLELKQALVEQRRLKRTIVRQIRQAIRGIETAIKRVEVTRAATVLAQTQLEAEQEKFRLGLSTSFFVLNFQGELTIARSEETRALSDYNVALARLDQITGTLRYGDVTTGTTR
jgi:outer membrane protein TolC